MKKITVAILASLYLLLTSGVSVNFHYCMGKLSSVKVGYTSTDRCTKCGMKAKKAGCCHDTVQLVKVNDNHQATQADINIQAPVFSLPHPEPVKIDAPFYSSLTATVGYHPPPILQANQDLNTMHCIFKI